MGRQREIGRQPYPGVTTHGLSRTRFYRLWQAMINRCTRPSNVHFEKYAGRGITICEAWFTFENFKADLYEGYLAHVAVYGPKDTTLDRRDNDGNYEPGNCRWVTCREQSNNTRLQRPFVATNLATGVQTRHVGIRRTGDDLGICWQLICRVLAGGRRTAGGYAFQYETTASETKA